MEIKGASGLTTNAPEGAVLTRDDVFERVRVTMQELFEVEADKIQPDTKLIEDLQLDSIDAIDLAARLEEITRHRLGEEQLRTLRTVDDVVTLIHQTMSGSGATDRERAQPVPEGSGE